jgi:hypothetical protein
MLRYACLSDPPTPDQDDDDRSGVCFPDDPPSEGGA